MFEAGGGVPVQDQFHQFIASSSNNSSAAAAAASRTPSNSISSVPLPLPNFLHASSSFDPYTFASSAAAAASSTSAQQVQHFLHQLHQLPHPPQPSTTTTKINNQAGKVQENNNNNNNNSMVGMNLEINERDQTSSADSWSNDEVLALLRIRSSMENWFPDFTWENVSRKLAEVGFKLRSGEKCKEKFEEESRYFNTNIHFTNNNKISNYTTVFSEFEDLYHHDHDQVGLAADQENKKRLESDHKPISDDHHDQEQDKIMRQSLQEDEEEDNIINNNPRNDHQTDEMRSRSSTRNNINKRKRRHKKFEMLKGFCEGVVKRLMDQQEEMHNKILEDMVRRDEEKVAREETWKKQEMDRMNKEIEVRAQEQAVAGDRQSKIINFLKQFTPTNDHLEVNKKVPQNPNPQIESSSSSSLPPHDQNPSSSDNAPISLNNQKIQSLSPPPPQNPSKSLPPQKLHTKSTLNEKLDHDIGKRWPRDEVLALINLRSSTVYNNNCNNNDHQEMMKEGGGNSNNNNNNNNKDQIKAPLWERISQGMAELGYKRSAKRCKEKWENINKYFRKTKDINKKRSVDSRTCPYFHQLSNLYNNNNQASSVVVIAPPSDDHDDHTGPAENRSVSPENRSDVPEANGSSPTPTTSTLHGLEGDKNAVQGPGFDYEH